MICVSVAVVVVVIRVVVEMVEIVVMVVVVVMVVIVAVVVVVLSGTLGMHISDVSVSCVRLQRVEQICSLVRK